MIRRFLFFCLIAGFFLLGCIENESLNASVKPNQYSIEAAKYDPEKRLKDALPFIECLSTDWTNEKCVKIKNDTSNIAYKVFNDVKMQKRLDSICGNLKDKPEFVKPCKSLGKYKE